MKYIFLCAVFFATPALAQIKIDDGIREPQQMMASGKSVIDDEDKGDNKGADELNLPSTLTEEEKQQLDDGLEDVKIIPPITPESPSYPAEPTVPKKKVKQVIKPITEVKVRRSIADDRIDDGYVQEMVKDNYLFTPNYKDIKNK